MSTFSPPLLLAGPILRKVTLTSASVWVATSQPCSVKFDVYGSAAFLTTPPGASTGTVSAPPVGSNSRETVQLGGALYLSVVTAPLTGVPPDTTCSYNVTLTVQTPAPGGPSLSGGQTGTWDLGGLKLLDLGDPSDDFQGGLGLAAGRLPSFPTPPADVAALRIYHGSCFKLHGDGQSIMANLDDLLQDALPFDAPGQQGTPETPSNPADHPKQGRQRPHMLLLTGDQIYADDVATPLLPLLTQLGADLMLPPGSSTSQETVPVPGASPANQPVDQTTFPAGRRQKLVRMTGGMTSDDAHNHLIGLGEWAALYLLSWTGRLLSTGWSARRNRAVARAAGGHGPRGRERTTVTVKDGSPPETITPNPDGPRVTATTQTPVTLDPQAKPSPIESLLTPLFPDVAHNTDVAAKWRNDLRDDFPTQRDDVTKVGDDGDKVRRALANIPVLTICDDHEVSDDWFITGAWRSRVLASTLGRAIVRNALISYVLFQGWGNKPEAFETAGTPEAQFLSLVPRLFNGSGTLPDPGTCQQLERLLGLDDPTGTGDSTDRLAFNYQLDVAGGRLVVLDTRTHREYGTPNGPPGLLTQAALDAQLPITLTDDVPLLIVVSPAPVLGPRLIEELLTPAATRGYDLYHLAIRNAAEAAAAGYDTHQSIGDLYFDVESWSARPDAFERFLARVTRCPQVVILAGDVHYAASFVMDYQRFTVAPSDGGVPPNDPPPHSSSSRVVHFTASAFRNAWQPRVATFARSISVAENLERIGFAGASLGFTRMTPPALTGGDDAAGEARPLRARLHREPVILPTEGWKNRHPIRHPEWAYQVAPIFDTRTDDVQLSGPGHRRVPQKRSVRACQTRQSRRRTARPQTAGSGSGGPYETATALHAANGRGRRGDPHAGVLQQRGSGHLRPRQSIRPVVPPVGADGYLFRSPPSSERGREAPCVRGPRRSAGPESVDRSGPHWRRALTMSTSSPPPDQNSTDILTRLSTWLGSVLNDILRLLADAEGGQLLLAEQGWNAGAPVLPAQLLSRLDQQTQSGSDASVQAAESFAEVLIALAAFTEALVNVPNSQASGVTALELVADVLDATMALRVREDYPVVWAVLRLLNLIADDGAQLANLSDLVGDARRYLSGLVTGPGYAQAWQDYSTAILGSVGTALTFIPPIPRHGSHDPHGHDTTSFRSEVLYGWTPAGPGDHPHLMELLERTMTWRLDAQVASSPNTPAAEEVVDLTFALVPHEHNQGSWGLFLRLSGATAITIPLGAKKADGTPTGWQLAITSTDGVALVALFGDHGFLRGAGSGFNASIALERPADISGSWVIGSPQGTHVEIQHARVALTISDDSQSWLLDAGASAADHASSSTSPSAVTRFSARCSRSRYGSTRSWGWGSTPGAAST